MLSIEKKLKKLFGDGEPKELIKKMHKTILDTVKKVVDASS
jgi:hypothetical protein